MNGMSMENEKLFVVSAYSENQVGLLSTIANVFTRRNINIESITVFPSDFPGIHRYTIRARTTEALISKLVKQIEKKVYVVKAFYYVDNEWVCNEKKAISAFLKEREDSYKNE